MITGEIHIGGANTQECVPFNCNPFTERKCCYYNSWSPSPSYLQRNMTPISLSVYGDAPISYSLSMEWTTDSMDHYPTDLGLVNNSRTDPNVWVSLQNHSDTYCKPHLELVTIVGII